MMLVSLILLTASCLHAQGVVVSTGELRFQAANSDPKGTLMEQVKQVQGRIKGKVYRYRVFVRPDADPGLISTVLRAPVVSIIRVASLPTPNQKVAVEAVTSGGSNPQGLVFISGQGITMTAQQTKMKPLVETAFDNLDKALKGVQLTPADVLIVTCYTSSLEDVAEVRSLTTSRYSGAVQSHLQIPVAYGRAAAECEAVARGRAPVGFVYPEGLSKSPNFTQVAGISAKRMVWSGLHTSIGCTQASVRQMFQKLEATLKKNGASVKDVAFSYLYPSSVDGTEFTRALRFEFYNKEQPPASTLMPFSGFEDKTACTGVEVVAPVN